MKTQIDILMEKTREVFLDLDHKQSEPRDDLECLIEDLDILLARLRRYSNKTHANNPLPSSAAGISGIHPLWQSQFLQGQQSHHTHVPQVRVLEPSKPHYSDVRCS